MMRKLFLSGIVVVTFSPRLFASASGSLPISQLIGVEYSGKAPDGIKLEATVGLSTGPLIGDAVYKLSRGHLGPQIVLWTHERAAHGLHSGSKVIDVVEISKLSNGEAFMDRCFVAGAGKTGNVYATGIMGTAGKTGVVRAWGIDLKTGHIVSLSPRRVECEEDETGD